MSHQDYMFKRDKTNWAERLVNWFILLLVVSAILALPTSMFISFHTYQTNELIKKRLATIEFNQESILLNNYNYTVCEGKR